MAWKESKGVSRRLVLLGGLAAGGGLAVGAALWPWSRLAEQRDWLAEGGQNVLLGSVKISGEGAVTVIYPHADMGVGNGTALAQMLAEELDADWSQVSIERAPAELAFANQGLAQGYLRGDIEIPSILAGTAAFAARKIAEQMRLQITGGSTAIRFTGVDGMRQAGAAARDMLLRAAAKSWGVDPASIKIAEGRITHASGKEAGFGEFAAAALEFSPPAAPRLKDPAEYRIVGKPVSRFDIPAKVDGRALYSADLRLEGMVFAAIRATPVPGGSLASVDMAPARAMKGVIDVVRTEDAVAVLADNYWRARQAVEALDPQWSDGPNSALDSAVTIEAMKEALEAAEGEKDYIVGDGAKALGGGGAEVEARYTVPYLAHAAMEPVGCVAQFKDGKLIIDGAFQDALSAKFRAAEVSGLSPDKVQVLHTEMGGAFGRRGGTLDYLDHAIRIAQQTDRPVNLLYSREEDMTHDFYRNASAALMRAELGANGLPSAISYRYAEKDDPVEASRIPYAIAHQEARFVKGISKAPFGPWRSVDHSIHGFFIESFIDELAVAAGQDPLAYRLALLKDKPRHAKVLSAAAENARWQETRPEGTALGIALVESFGTIVAEVAEVSVDADGNLRVLNVWVAADPGEVVNPNGFAQQMESGVIYGLSAALYGEITFSEGRVQQSNFTDYPVVRMADCPAIHVETIASGARTGGAGEPGTPPIAAAVANAVFKATGKRIRELPLAKADLRRAVTPS